VFRPREAIIERVFIESEGGDFIFSFNSIAAYDARLQTAQEGEFLVGWECEVVCAREGRGGPVWPLQQLQEVHASLASPHTDDWHPNILKAAFQALG
jgi:hypothetical protein